MGLGSQGDIKGQLYQPCFPLKVHRKAWLSAVTAVPAMLPRVVPMRYGTSEIT